MSDGHGGDHGGGGHGGGDHGGGGHGGGGSAVGAALGALVSFSAESVGKLIIGVIGIVLFGTFFNLSLGQMANGAAEWIPAIFGFGMIIYVLYWILNVYQTVRGLAVVHKETYGKTKEHDHGDDYANNWYKLDVDAVKKSHKPHDHADGYDHHEASGHHEGDGDGGHGDNDGHHDGDDGDHGDDDGDGDGDGDD